MKDSSVSPASQPSPDPACIPLDNQVIIRVSGPGTDKFLHGQFSQSLDDATSSFSPLAAACTPKGRTYCLTRLVRDGDDILLNLPVDLAETTLNQLRKYLMLFRGTTMAPDPSMRMLGILGTGVAKEVYPAASQNLRKPGDTAVIDGHRLVRTMDTAEGLGRYELWQKGPLTGSLEDSFAATPTATMEDWQATEIAAGVAALTAATVESYVPQMLNWQCLGGIHFRKGCYTGQEVVARMHFLGQLKKSLFRLRAEAARSTPEPGTTVQAGEKNAGEVVNATALADGSVELLAVLRHATAGETLTLADKTPLRIMPLPYPVPERQSGEPADT